MPPREVRRSQEVANADEIAMTIVVDSVRYRFDLSNITARMELDLYQQSGGLRLLKVMEELSDGATGFHIAAMVYLARRAEGENDITFDDVAEHMGLASDIEVIDDDEVGSEGSDDAPKVIAAS